MDLSELALAAGFMFLMCWTPGPNTMLCAAHGNRHGWRATLHRTRRAIPHGA